MAVMAKLGWGETGMTLRGGKELLVGSDAPPNCKLREDSQIAQRATAAWLPSLACITVFSLDRKRHSEAEIHPPLKEPRKMSPRSKGSFGDVEGLRGGTKARAPVRLKAGNQHCLPSTMHHT